VAAIGNEPSDDDEGLRWDGDDEPVTPVARPERSVETEPAEATPTNSVLLVVYGIIAGAYVLYTVGWIFAAGLIASGASTILAEIMFQFGEFLAIASPAVWFGTTLLLTRHRKPAVRLLWLILGLVVLAPLPFILGGVQ